MKTQITLPKIRIPRAKGVADELNRIHLTGVDAWLGTVARLAGGGPWSGESLGSLRPVADVLRAYAIFGDGPVILEQRIAGRKIQSEDDWKRFPKHWRYHLSTSGEATTQIKTPELGAQVQAPGVKFFRDGTRRIFRFEFDVKIFQFAVNEKGKSLSLSSPWESFEAGRKAYKETVQKEYKESFFFQSLFRLERE